MFHCSDNCNAWDIFFFAKRLWFPVKLMTLILIVLRSPSRRKRVAIFRLDGGRKTIKIRGMRFTGNHSLLWKRRCLKICSYPSNGTQFRALEKFHRKINFYECLKYEPSNLDFRDLFGHYRYLACSKHSCCPKTSPLLHTLKPFKCANDSIKDDIFRRLWECSMEIKLKFHVVSGAITLFRVRKF